MQLTWCMPNVAEMLSLSLYLYNIEINVIKCR